MSTPYKSKPITFIATYQPPTEECDEDFDIERVTPNDEREPGYDGSILTDTDWFDEERINLGNENFLNACSLLDDVKRHGKIRATVTLELRCVWTGYGDEWDMSIEVESVDPVCQYVDIILRGWTSP